MGRGRHGWFSIGLTSEETGVTYHLHLSETEAQVLDNVLHDENDQDAGDAMASRELAHKLLATLKPADRLVLTMMDMEGRSVADVQRATGWSATLVKVRAFRARRKLRKAFEVLENSPRRAQ